MVSIGANYWSSGACVTAFVGFAILKHNAVVIFLVISVPLAAHCVFADIDAVL